MSAGGSSSGGTSSGGSAGSGEAYCAHQCTQTSDCTVSGTDVGLTCKDNLCTSATGGCTSNEACIALLSGWSTPCTAGGGECNASSQVCVKVPGGGACATPPSEFFMCDTVPGWGTLDVSDIDGNPVKVCGNPKAQCNTEGYCFSPCASDKDCTSESYPHCNTSTGICGCKSNDECAKLGSPQFSVCNGGLCGCGTDQHCIDGKQGDVCHPGGFCGCSGNNACAGVTNAFDGGSIQCVKF